ncbi:MAG TPA: PAS domain S-box protein [Vicinamibacterales bacterium]|nr:PAS domain S-box protein [Vicinamibacterales bacterium]
MATSHDEDALLRSVALQNAQAILHARQRAEEDLVRAQGALRESQERLTAALVAAGTGTFRWNIRDNTVEWDGNLDRLFGLPSGRSVQSLDTFFGAVHPDDRAAVIAACERSAREGADFDMEFRVVWPDGSIHWICDKAKAFIDDNGVAIYLTGACADVTSRRQAAELLRDNEARLRAIFNQAAVGIAIADMDGCFLDHNQKFSEILGYSPDEVRGLRFVDITHPDDVAATVASARRLVSGEIDDYALEKRYRRKDGSTVWSLTTVTLLKADSGQPERFIGVIEDISARRTAEDALREETRVLELLNHTGTTLAAQLDLQSLLQAVTDAATELSGGEFGAFFYNTTDDNGDALLLYTLSGAPREAFEKFGKPRATALFGPTFHGEAATIRLDDVLADPRYGQSAPHHGMPRGHLPVRSYLAVPVRSRTGEVIGGLFFGHSRPAVFTERAERLILGVAAQAGIAVDNARLYEAAQKSAEERSALLESERAARTAAERLSEVKDEFLATLSHELRTPLNAILGWAHMLRTGSNNEDDVTRGLETIERNARAQTLLIDDLLDMSRITSGKLRLDIQPLQPLQIIEAAIETVTPSAQAKGIRLESFLDPAAGPINGDPGRLQQVVWNLLSNAIKFTPKDGKIQIVLQRVNSHVEIAVADTGVGIRAEFMPHLFERFRQGDASTTRRFGGLGLGLSIVKSLVELHGGTVAVKSPGEGLGTTVSVQLPQAIMHRTTEVAAERVHPRTASPNAPPAVSAELAGLTVLVVDDQPDARHLIKRVLEEYAATVLIASSADEAMEILETNTPDVLISDIGMPVADGFELLKRVRALSDSRGGKIAAIALTAFARSEDRTRALRAGFLVHVAKPVDPAELVATVASVAGRVDNRIR